MKTLSNTKIWILTIGFAVSLFVLLFVASKESFLLIVIGFSTAFYCYSNLSYSGAFWRLVSLGLIVRLVSLASFPSLSDDLYRFIWDGLQWTQGSNPFHYLPSEKPNLSGFETMLLGKMNSPDYYSIYPPVLQLLFITVVTIFPSPLLYQTILLKLILILIELVGMVFTIKLLDKLKQNRNKVFIYYLNPLVIVELIGNLHMEVVMISFLGIFLYFLYQDKILLSSIFLSLSISSKLLTLLVTPFLIKRLTWNKLVYFSVLLGLQLILLFVLMLYGNFNGFITSLDLYFQNFEFNASIYFVFRELGYLIKGYNLIYTIGPSLSIIAAVGILYMAYRQKQTNIESICTLLLFALTLYLLLSTTVHPWYITTLVFLSIFTGFKYPIIWSYVAVLSYSHYYLEGQYYYWMIGIEYVILFAVIILESKSKSFLKVFSS